MTEEKFKKVVEQYEKLVFTICLQMVRDYQEAQNLTQETFLSAYYHIDGCTGDSYKPWLARIATNKAKDYLKSAYVRKVELAREEDKQADVISLEPLPDDLVLEREGIENIRRLIYQLKEPYLQVSILYFLEERSVEEIAQILNRPKKTVHTQIARAKNLLRKSIEREV